MQTGGSEGAGINRHGRAHAPKQRPATPILHFLSTEAFATPFDVNVAVDAGLKVVIPHTNAGFGAHHWSRAGRHFSRPVEYGSRTGLFIGGKDALLALDMLAAVQTALVPPFQLSAFAGPGGSFTTAAAMVALWKMSIVLAPVAR